MIHIILAPLERAADDGCDVVNMSLGALRGEVYQQGVLVRAVDILQKRGVVVVAAIGNAGTAGPFLPSSPALAKTAIAAAASYNSDINDLAGDGTLVPCRIMFPGVPPPGVGTYPIYDFGTATCTPVPEGTRFDGQVVPVKRGAFSCFAHRSACWPMRGRRGRFGGRTPPTTHSGPRRGGNINNPYRIPAVTVREIDADAIPAQGPGATMTWGFYTQLAAPLFPGLTTDFSSWGPSHELDFKPEVMAPGGYVPSSIQMGYGSYGLMDGTSMSSPDIAGIAAVMLSANPKLKAHEVRDYLMNTAVPLPYTADPSLGLHPAAQQGAGLADALAAVMAVAKTSLSKIAMHDLDGRTFTQTITIENKNKMAVTYNVSHVPALTAAPPMTSRWIPSNSAATVTLSTPLLAVPAGGEASFTASFEEPSDVAGGSILSGWIELAPVGGGKALRVPYMGLKGDYHELPAINPTFTDVNTTLDNPALRPESRPNCSGPPPTRPRCCSDPTPGSCGWSVGKDLPLTLDYTNDDKYAAAALVMISRGFPLLRKYRGRVLDESGKTVAWTMDRYTGLQFMDPFGYVVRNSGAGTGTDFAQWHGELDKGGMAPSGTYYIRIEFDKFQGDGHSYPDFETWTSPPITVIAGE